MTKNIGFIGGGQMAEALIKGILSVKFYASSHIYLVEPNEDRKNYMIEEYGVEVEDNLEGFWKKCSTIIIAVKPQIMSEVLGNSKAFCTDNHLIISIAAGVPISFFEEILGNSTKLIRVMPNTPCLVLEGASALSCNEKVTDRELSYATEIFNAVGSAIVVKENYLNSVTGLSGSGPAYVYSFLEALIDAGVKTGLPRESAELLSVQTILGSIRLFEEKKEHPAVLRSRVTSPGGTTIAGLHVLEKAGFRGIIMDAVEAATNRSKELGKK